MKLEIKHLAPYLPYGLNAIDIETKEIRKVTLLHFTYDNDSVGHNHLIYEGLILSKHKPVLRPLSDLSNNEWYDIFVSDDIDDIWNKWLSDNSLDCIEYYLVTILIENHFDIFGLIENGLAIDINTLNQ